MIDTLILGYKIDDLGAAEVSEFARQSVSGNVEFRGSMDVDTGESNEKEWHADIRGLGACRLYGNGFLGLPYYALPRWHVHFETGKPMELCDNNTVLTAAQADAAFQALTERAEKTFGMLEPSGLSVSRADVVYQREVPNAMEVLNALYGAMRPTAKGTAWYNNANGQATGLVLKGLEVVHKVYDKGKESGHIGLLNHLRSEEQLRSKAAAFSRIVDVESRSFDRGECLDTLNSRYLESTGEVLDVSPLIAAGKFAPALFSLRPDLMDAYREQVDRKTYYRMRAAVRKIRAAAVPFNMSVPDDAWT